MPKTNYFMAGEITAYHAVNEALLIGLVDHASGALEICLALSKENIAWNILFYAAAQRVPDTDKCWVGGMSLYLPHAIAAVPAMLFKNSRPPLTQTKRQFRAEFL